MGFFHIKFIYNVLNNYFRRSFEADIVSLQARTAYSISPNPNWHTPRSNSERNACVIWLIKNWEIVSAHYFYFSLTSSSLFVAF